MPFLVKLSIVKDARPKFLKPPSVLFALRECVASELDRLEAEGVIEKTMYSESVSGLPLCCSSKHDGHL